MTDRSRRPRYAELHAHSAFSFLDGASQPEELAAEASRLGLEALAVTDHDGLYGVVRFAEAARRVGLPTVFGAELHLPAPTARRHGREPAPPPGPPVLDEPTGVPDPRSTHLLVLARGPDGYRALSRAIAEGHLRTGRKGAAEYDLEDLAATAAGQWLVLTGCRKGAVRRALAGGDPSGVQPVAPGGPQAAARELDRLVALFGRDNVAVELTAAGTRTTTSGPTRSRPSPGTRACRSSRRPPRTTPGRGTPTSRRRSRRCAPARRSTTWTAGWRPRVRTCARPTRCSRGTAGTRRP